MSASAQGLPENSGRANGVWLALSLVFHAAILAWLIFLIPATEIAIEKETGRPQAAAPIAASPGRIQEVAEQIQATQADEARAKVEELLQTSESLGELQEKTRQEFSTLASELAAEAPKKTSDSLADAAEAQAAAEKAQAEALQAMEAAITAQAAADAAATPGEKTARRSEAAAASARATDAQAAAAQAQITATTAQTGALQQLNFQEGLAVAKTALEQAAATQRDANAKQDEAGKLQKTLDSQDRQAEREAQNTALAQASVDSAKQRVSSLESTVANNEQVAREQKARLDELNKQQADPKSVAEIRKELDRANNSLAPARKNLQRARQLLNEEISKLTQVQAGIQKRAAAQAELPGQTRAAQAAALAAQQKARTLQAAAQAAIAKGFAESTAAKSAPPAQEQPAGPAPSLEGKDFAALYATAVQTEKAIAGKFQSIRAAQVAVQKQIPLAEARKYVQIALPIRSELPPAATTPPADAASLAAHNEAIEKAMKELTSIVSLTRGMAAQAEATASSAGQGVNISIEGMKAQAVQEQQLAALAAENAAATAVDLTGLMKQIAGNGAPGSGTPGEAAGGGPNAKTPASAGSAPPALPAAGAKIDAIPGRKIHGSDYTVGSKWMFVDTWWIIGPFPNPDRRNIETRFPPESVIDLDASYPVEGGTLRWHFVQNSTPMVRPPDERNYSIYYAYTELWFDQERDLWIAVGSDDYSKLWINNLPVWASGTEHKSWRANEGYRKVHFKQGLNRVLMRVENGHLVCAFSLMLGTQANP